MAEQPRLSELIGIDREHRDSDHGWLFTAVLATLGGATLWMAFRYLSPTETRLLQNPWTYALAVPLGLVVLSFALRTVVSLVVERSVQLAFLMSLVVHLLLLIFAFDMVIPSRLFPDFFEDLERQRQILQKQQKIPLYFKLASATSGDKRPDYLRFMPTRHQATEVQQVGSAMLRTAHSESAKLPHLALNNAPTVTPHELQRRNSSDSRSSPNLNLSHIERSTLSSSSAPISTLPQGLELTSVQPSQLLEPSSIANVRHASPTGTVLPAPEAASVGQIASLADRLTEMQRRQISPSSPSTSNDPLVNFVRPRTAGGDIGAATRMSLPIQAPDLIGAPESGISIRPSRIADNSNRQSPVMLTPSSMPALGLPQSLMFDDLTHIGPGYSGEALAELAPRAAGQATSTDEAGLTGNDRELARSVIGLAAAPSSNQASIAVEVPDVQTLANLLEVTDAKPEPGNTSLAAKGLDHRTISQDSSKQLVKPQTLDHSSTLLNSQTPLSQRASLGDIRDREPTSSLSAEPLSRSRLEHSAEVLRRQIAGNVVDLPAEIDESISASSPNPNLTANESTDRVQDARSRAAISIPLAINANLDAPSALERRVIELPPMVRNQMPVTVADGAANLFERRMNLVPPKPAFQNRLNRLADEALHRNSQAGPLTELAIERGLIFLAKHQQSDGRWRLQDFDTQVLIRSDTAAIGLSLLAFQGAGYTHQQFKHAAVVDKALRFLVQHQKSDGDLYIPQDPASDQNAWLYSHAIATLALCEAYGMTQDEALKAPAQKAVAFMLASQDAQRGGWRYRPASGSDTSVTGWFTMALKSAQLAGLTVPKESLDRLTRFLDQSRHSRDKPHLFRYNPFAPDSAEQRHGLEPTVAMTSVGLLMRLYLGWQRTQPEMIAGADHLLQYPPTPGTRSKSRRDTYYWYYATQVMFHMGGERWKQWQAQLHAILIQDQITQGEFAGSWDPYLPTPDIWAPYAGRLYVTTMNLLSLEVNYRHLPLYDMTAK